MSDNFDVEKALGKYKHTPGEATKQSITDEFGRASTAGNRGRRPAGFWRKPVPMYSVAAALVVAIGLSFVVGQRTSRPDERPAAMAQPSPDTAIMSSHEIEWVRAERDVL
jgi:hypothetical protein